MSLPGGPGPCSRNPGKYNAFSWKDNRRNRLARPGNALFTARTAPGASQHFRRTGDGPVRLRRDRTVHPQLRLRRRGGQEAERSLRMTPAGSFPAYKKTGGPPQEPARRNAARRQFMRNFMGSMDSAGKKRSRNSTMTSTMRKGAMPRTSLPILMLPMPQTT